ncbi:helix-turn-helix transcriptional regulator [Nocardioides eburneiflavus]|uniref:Helix-turn-helix transcriptional regulator n=1 Tax=Nocardioides eburneiflavus TaxID=2518372 RepID=A0A4Z1C7E2_9ACTN|nr:LuxR C-terminal-related transcriptional regulator [Nocardioides eburneiflavus]TGN65372.1 helix-turn-helix transcriptional regulator [Nocardioides eburneiflavus]
MVDALVQTKLAFPRVRPGLVARARLTEELQRTRDAAMTLVSAPAGFGKTTLLASAYGDAAPVAWVSLDSRDGDASRFWTYVLHALDIANPGCASTALNLLESAGGGALADVVASLVNELSVRTEDVTLVLDDYHLADTPEVSETVGLLLEHRPPQLRLVLGTRADPALPLSRLRARGELVEIRAADLRFTATEADDYLNEVHGLGLTESDVKTLETRTEGWAAALQLAAVSLRGRDDSTGFIASFAGDDRFVVDFLADEVLDQQPDALRRFLLDTSVLDRLSGSLCDAVTGPVDGMAGGAALELLERRNLLLVPLDDHRRWYRYHHLFADVLHVRLLAERPGDIPALHGRASRWFEQTGDVEAAVRHSFAAGDVDRAADLIEVATPDLRRRRAERLLRSWVPAVPMEVLARRPVLASNLAGGLMASNLFDGVSERLDAIESTLASPPTDMVVRDENEWRRLPAVVATHRSGLALVAGDLEATRQHADIALERAGGSDQLTVASASALKGLASWTVGDLVAARDGYRAAAQGLAAVGHVSDVLACTITVVDLELALGNLDAAQRAAQDALDLAGAAQDGLQADAVRGTADMRVALARVAWERGESDEAAELLRAAGDLGDDAGLPQQPYRWRLAMAALREREGDREAAEALLAEAERLFNSDFLPNVRPVPAVHARLHIRCGDLPAARRWAAGAGVGVEDDPRYLREYEHVTLARLLLAEHDATRDAATLESAATLLRRLRGSATAGARTAAVVETSILLALTADAAGDVEQALSWLTDAAAPAQAVGWVRPFLDAGPRVQHLLALLPEGSAFAGAVAAAARDTRSVDSREAPGLDDVETLVVPLSARELDVLRLLGSDLDGPAIARHLNVSLPTVRTHTQRIYMKLGVNNRRAAVRRAHQLRL